MEMQKSTKPVSNKGLWIAGLQRNKLAKFDVSIKLVDSLWKSKNNKKFKPDVVIGTVVLQWTVIKMASMMGIPTVIQEQNSFPGIRISYY
jgi:UDP-N-acetylglucosamine--N-acetylmuramyl-(pentapeptide) pyrophosphoryl-undecaprenol N-acetylglucosamine transferase